MSATRRIAVALLTLASAACAGHAHRPSPLSALDAPRTVSDAPLAARLLPPFHNTLRFVLSEPAYVTIFEIVPGRGVSVVYPAPFDDSRTRALSAGSHGVFAVPYNVGRWFYSDLPVAAAQPTFLYMIASREPLRIGRVLDDPASLRRIVGFANFAQSNEQRTMDALDERFVPRFLDDDAWASDYLALWPEPALDRTPVDPRLALAACNDGGIVVVVPGTPPAYVCRPAEAKRPPATTPTPPADTTAKPQPPHDAPNAGKPTPVTPRDGQRPPAPRKVRSEPMTLTVDYGVPSTSLADGERTERTRAASRQERPRERSRGQTSADRGAFPGERRYDDGYADRRSRETSHGRPAAASDGPAPRTERTERPDASPRSPAPRAAEPRSERPSSPRSTQSGQ